MEDGKMTVSEFAKVIEEYRQALMWASASMDYQINGKARLGWEKICKPLLGNGGDLCQK